MPPRLRVPQTWERLELTARAITLSMEIATLSMYVYLTVRYWYDHATNPVAYTGACLAILTDLLEMCTLSVLDRPSWPQVSLTYVALGDVLSAILLFASWSWVATRGMFWEGTVDWRGETFYVNYEGGAYPDVVTMQASWILPIVIGAMHMVLIALYSVPFIRASFESPDPYDTQLRMS